MLEWLLSLPRYAKRAISVLADVFFSDRFHAGGNLCHARSTDCGFIANLPNFLLLSVPITILAFTKLGLYRAVVRYIGQHALGAVLAGILSNAMILVMLFQLVGIADKGNLVFVYAILALVTSGGLRLVARMFLFQRHNGHKQRGADLRCWFIRPSVGASVV